MLAYLFLFIKLSYCQKATKFEKQAHVFLKLLSQVKQCGRFFKMFLIFSEYIFELYWVTILLSRFNCCYSYISTLLFYVSLYSDLNKMKVEIFVNLARLFLPNCYLGISLCSYFKLKLLFKGSLNVFSIRLIHARSIKIRTLVYILIYLFLSRWNRLILM